MDPNLQIRGKPSHPHPDNKRWGGGGGGGWAGPNQKIFWASVWSQNKEGSQAPRALPLDLPLIIIIVIIILIIDNNDDDLKEAYLLVISISTRGAIL